MFYRQLPIYALGNAQILSHLKGGAHRTFSTISQKSKSRFNLKKLNLIRIQIRFIFHLKN